MNINDFSSLPLFSGCFSVKMSSNDEKSNIFINYNENPDQWKRFGSKISSEFRERAKLAFFLAFSPKCPKCQKIPKNTKKCQFRWFSELRRDFWSKSFLLDWICSVIYEFMWFFVITAHYCSLLLIFGHISAKCRKWAVTSSNEQQWREIRYIH